MSCEEEDTYRTCVEWCITRHTPPSPLTTTSAPLGLVRFTLVGAKLNLTNPKGALITCLPAHNNERALACIQTSQHT